MISRDVLYICIGNKLGRKSQEDKRKVYLYGTLCYYMPDCTVEINIQNYLAFRMFISNMTSDPYWRKHKSPQAMLSSKYSTPDISHLCGLSLLGLLIVSILHFKHLLALNCRRVAAVALCLSSLTLGCCLADHIKSEHAMPAEDLPLFSLHEHRSCLFEYAPETLSWGTTAQKERGRARRGNKITLGIN